MVGCVRTEWFHFGNRNGCLRVGSRVNGRRWKSGRGYGSARWSFTPRWVKTPLPTAPDRALRGIMSNPVAGLFVSHDVPPLSRLLNALWNLLCSVCTWHIQMSAMTFLPGTKRQQSQESNISYFDMTLHYSALNMRQEVAIPQCQKCFH